MTGRFITFEGGEGSGKSTQIKKLYNHLTEQGHKVILTREPGGSSGAEAIRTLLVQAHDFDWPAMTELLLMQAARIDHVEKTIKPALERGDIVLCDRYFDSTVAYQGYGRGLDLTFLNDLYMKTLGNFKPDQTFIFDIPVQEGLKRSQRRLSNDQSSESHFESIGIDFHERVRKGFSEIAQNNPKRCNIIPLLRDGTPLPPSQIFEKLLSLIIV